MGPRAVLDVMKRSFQGLFDDRAPMMGAALAYYALFAIAPLLLGAILALTFLLGEKAGPELFDRLRRTMGPNAVTVMQSMVQAAASQARTGLLPAVVAGIALAFGALGAFLQLQTSLDLIWGAEPSPEEGFWWTLGRRLLSFAALAVVLLVLLVSLLVSAAIPVSAVLQGFPGSHALWSGLDFAASFVVVSALFSAVFRLLPDVRLSWSDVLLGGAFTGLLFAVGKQLLAWYLGRSAVRSAYGAAGSIVVVLLWVYYSSEIFLFGAEFTHAWVTRAGRTLEPKRGARLVERRI